MKSNKWTTLSSETPQAESLSSIRPGSSAGDPQVVDLRCLQYLPDGSVSYKINYTEQS